jgi:hypothetical protein
MPELSNSGSSDLQEAGGPLSTVPAEDGAILKGIVDYITPPSKRVITVTVRYSAARKGAPMSYELAQADEEP